MRTLAIDCATEACSVALFDRDALLAHDHRVLGRGHAERLVPMIADLPGKGRAERILVSRGPGSFTGVRIGIATARALGVAWSAEVRGYPTLALVAAIARAQAGPQPLSVAMAGGHGEWFFQTFDAEGTPALPPQSLKPAAAIANAEELVAGTRATELVEQRGAGKASPLHPDARFALALPPESISADVSAIYGRPPDAKPANAKPAT